MDTFHAVKSSRSLVFNKTDVLKKFAKLRKKQKQPHEGVLKKRCSESIQQIYRRTPMSKCDFNKVAKQLY